MNWRPIFPMIDKRSHRNLRRQLRRSANMVIVIMRNQHKINLLDARIFRSGGDTVCVAPAISRPPPVDPPLLPPRRDKHPRLPPLPIYQINLRLFFPPPNPPPP